VPHPAQTSTAVDFPLGIIELQIRENRIFLLPVYTSIQKN